jgi:hypothetical protein
VNAKKRLFVGSVVCLAAFNVLIFNSYATIAAIALIAVVVLCLKASTPRFVGASAFLLAEVSPGSLHAPLSSALVYQGLCVLLLVSVLSVHENANSLAVYKSALPQTVGLAIIPFATFSLIVLTRAVALSANQIMACAVGVLLAVLCILLAAARDENTIVEVAGP